MANLRKTVRRRSRPPKFQVNWQALLVPPVVLAALIAFFVSGKTIFDRPVSQLIIEGPFQRVTAIQVEAALAPELGPGFLSIDLDRLRQRAESLDWIDSVKIRRVWPDKLVIGLTEHRAAARWGDHGLLNVRGELFTPNARHTFPELPRLAGPPGSEREVVEFYLAVRGRMAEASLMLGALHMDARGAWSMALAGGQKVRLGRHDIRRRLDTFFDVVAPVLATRFHEVDHVDLRYANGFAVGWLKAEPESGLSNTLEGYGNG
ncbi:cell division protein FtsQ/DivIB [Candidatus Rariloculus sp.]|uniref:cell division protein FtsQ/DivIB n=1 Tax=Candidatus Rariloculus sp. TaxID=3101265 RepID=UPI003D0FFF85